MNKCGGCGKFLSNSNSIKCCKCPATFHKDCVNIPAAAGVKTTWMCPGCKSKIPREDNTSTPVRGQAADYNSDVLTSPVKHTAETSKLDLASEIRFFRNELSALRAEVREIREEIVDFKTELKSCNESITKMDIRISALEHKFEERLPSDADSVQNTIAELRRQLNDRDQDLLLNDVEIAGIPETKDESILHLVKVISTKLGVDVDERDFVHAERVGSTRRNRVELTDGDTSASADPTVQRPRCISVRFARRTTRDLVLRAARVRRGLSSTDLQVPGTTSRVYINERLTRINRHLFYLARQAGNKHNWKYVWTRDGMILARKEDGRKTERIRCEKDIELFFM